MSLKPSDRELPRFGCLLPRAFSGGLQRAVAFSVTTISYDDPEAGASSLMTLFTLRAVLRTVIPYFYYIFAESIAKHRGRLDHIQHGWIGAAKHNVGNDLVT